MDATQLLVTLAFLASAGLILLAFRYADKKAEEAEHEEELKQRQEEGRKRLAHC